MSHEKTAINTTYFSLAGNAGLAVSKAVAGVLGNSYALIADAIESTTDIFASLLVVGSVSWLYYSDRLMEFPTALLGVALGVVLTPQLAAAQAAQDREKYSAMLDWGLRAVVLLAVPCAVALLTFARPLVAVLYHYGAFRPGDVEQTALALTGYGVGLLGLIAIKVLAPGSLPPQIKPIEDKRNWD